MVDLRAFRQAFARPASSRDGARVRGDVSRLASLLLAVAVLGGCGTMSSTAPVSVRSDAAWALLPIDNLSSTPLAGRAALGLVETRLRARGVARLALPPEAQRAALIDLLDARPSREENLHRVRAEGARYALGGTVHEWHYKSAPGREPVVGMSLTLLEVAGGRVLWQGSAARSGWREGSLTELADRLIGELLEAIRMRGDDADR